MPGMAYDNQMLCENNKWQGGVYHLIPLRIKK